MKKESLSSFPFIRTGLGQCSHRFLQSDSSKSCIIAGVIFQEMPGFQSQSDGDVIFYALCNAISSLTHVNIICGVALDLLNKEGITDSEVYLKEAKKTLGNQKITHISITLEAKRPQFKEFIGEMRKNIARLLDLHLSQVGITAIFGDGLTECGCGTGVSCQALITTQEEVFKNEL